MQHRALSDSAWLTRAARSLAVLLLLARLHRVRLLARGVGSKSRENESLRTELTSERQARKKCESDHAAANQQIDELKKQLTERGVSLDSLSASLAEQRRRSRSTSGAPSSSMRFVNASRCCRPS